MNWIKTLLPNTKGSDSGVSVVTAVVESYNAFKALTDDDSDKKKELSVNNGTVRYEAHNGDHKTEFTIGGSVVDRNGPVIEIIAPVFKGVDTSYNIIVTSKKHENEKEKQNLEGLETETGKEVVMVKSEKD